MDAILQTSFFLLVLVINQVSQSLAQKPLQHLSRPIGLWNQAIPSNPGNGNVVQISPDDKWVYITTNDGKLHRLNPANGGDVTTFTPGKRNEDGKGGSIPVNDVYQWRQYGQGGIEFYIDEEDDDNGRSYLVYWVFDVPPPSTGLSPSSRLFAIKHDESREMEVLWTKLLPGTIQGTPMIG